MIASLDPRLFQIAFLTCLLFFGVVERDFAFTGAKAMTVFATAFSAQAVGILVFRASSLSWLSAAISALSILLLCRSQSLLALALVTSFAILSKFLFRFQGKHFFNPTCFGIVSVWLLSDWIWISPAQWGSETLLVFWIVALGAMVARRARTDDISLAFLFIYSSLLAGRVAYLGQPSAVFWHQWQSGSLLVFSFFMISDPRSTPSTRTGRILFSSSVALLAYYLRFYRFHPNGLLLALFFLSPLTPILDTLFLGKSFPWEGVSWFSDRVWVTRAKSRLISPAAR